MGKASRTLMDIWGKISRIGFDRHLKHRLFNRKLMEIINTMTMRRMNIHEINSGIQEKIKIEKE
jgi:hypothetical protein